MLLHETIGLMDENGFGKNGENMNTMVHNEEGSARSEAGIVAMSMFFAGLLVVAFTSSPLLNASRSAASSSSSIASRARATKSMTFARAGRHCRLNMSLTLVVAAQRCPERTMVAPSPT